MLKSCPICSGGRGVVCDKCIDEFERLESNLNLKYIDKTIALFSYSGILKKLMLEFKFNHSYGLGKIMAYIMYREFLNLGFDFKDFDAVTFIPSDPKRFLKRGFNQGRVLAKYFSKYSGVPIKSILYRTKLEKESHKIKGIERKKLKHSFSTYDSRLKGIKRVIIVDDIITTGQTVIEAAKQIKIAADVEVFSLCMLGDFA